MEIDKMQKLQRKINNNNNSLINNKCKLVTIKQPTILELKILYQAIMRNKLEINNVFK